MAKASSGAAGGVERVGARGAGDGVDVEQRVGGAARLLDAARSDRGAGGEADRPGEPGIGDRVRSAGAALQRVAAGGGDEALGEAAARQPVIAGGPGRSRGRAEGEEAALDEIFHPDGQGRAARAEAHHQVSAAPSTPSRSRSTTTQPPAACPASTAGTQKSW